MMFISVDKKLVEAILSPVATAAIAANQLPLVFEANEFGYLALPPVAGDNSANGVWEGCLLWHEFWLAQCNSMP